MPRRPAKVTQADIARALRAACACEVPMVVEVLLDGTIRISPADISDDGRQPGLRAPVGPRKEIVL